MAEEITIPEEVGSEAPEGQVDSPVEDEDFQAEEPEDETPLEGQEYADEDEVGESENAPPDVSEQRIQELESQLAADRQRHADETQRFNTDMQQMRQYAQNLGMQQQPPQQRPSSKLPAEIDDWEPRQTVDYVLQQSQQQSQQYANQVIRQAMTQVTQQQNTFNQMLELLFEAHPDKDLVTTALQNMQGNQRPLDFTQSFAAEKGRLGTKRANAADKQLNKQSQEQRKRAGRAKKQTRRPQAARVKKTAYMSAQDALDQAGETLGR